MKIELMISFSPHADLFEDFLDLDPVKAAEKVIDKVEEIYFASINR